MLKLPTAAQNDSAETACMQYENSTDTFAYNVFANLDPETNSILLADKPDTIVSVSEHYSCDFRGTWCGCSQIFATNSKSF